MLKTVPVEVAHLPQPTHHPQERRLGKGSKRTLVHVPYDHRALARGAGMMIMGKATRCTERLFDLVRKRKLTHAPPGRLDGAAELVPADSQGTDLNFEEQECDPSFGPFVQASFGVVERGWSSTT